MLYRHHDLAQLAIDLYVTNADNVTGDKGDGIATEEGGSVLVPPANG